jgi:hypothetical protein
MRCHAGVLAGIFDQGFSVADSDEAEEGNGEDGRGLERLGM